MSLSFRLLRQNEGNKRTHFRLLQGLKEMTQQSTWLSGEYSFIVGFEDSR